MIKKWWRSGQRLAVFTLLWAGAGAVAAAPVSVVWRVWTESGADTYNWPAPATGSMQAASGDTFVIGASSLADCGDNAYNHWVTTWADCEIYGAIFDADIALWYVHLNYPGTLKAKTHYVGTGVLPVVENFRSEVTGTVEIAGDVEWFKERQLVVDSYTSTGSSSYDAQGGGTNPVDYPGGGEVTVVRAASNGDVTTLPDTFGELVQEWVQGAYIQFRMYVRGKQYLHSNKEEDVSLYTEIKADSSQGTTGFYGALGAFHFENGQVKVIKTYSLPEGS